MRYLRTNTATRVTVGPFIGTNGLTPQTSLTVTNEKLTFVVDDAGVPTLVLDTAPTASSGNNDMVHITGDDAGFYDLELTAANVNYLGRAMLALTDASNHAPVFCEFMIIPANVYDAMILGTDLLDVNTTQFNGFAVTQSGGRPEVNATHIAGSAVNTSSAQLGVNVVNAAGTAWDSGAITSGSLSSGARTAVENSVWDAVRASHTTVGTFGGDNTTVDAVATATYGKFSSQNAIVDGLPDDLTAITNAIAALPQTSGIRKNVALSNFPVVMVDSSDTPLPGLTVTATRSIDGGAYSAGTLAVTEVANGSYEVDFAAADLNGVTVMLRLTAPGAKTRFIAIKTTE